jgi:uncharacterized protein YlaI
VSRKNRHKIKSSGSDSCNICDERMCLQEHHLLGRKVPQYNHVDNIMYICPNCHTRIHTGEYIVEGWFNTSDGRELIWHKQGEPSVTGKAASVHTY